MAYHPICRKIEAQMRALLATALPAQTIRGSEHDAIYEPRSIRCTVETGDGVEPIPGIADCSIRIEVRTMLLLYANLATAKTDHDTLCGTVFDALMDADLATSLTVSGLTIHGVKSGENQTQRNENDALITTMSRVVRAVPQ